MLARILLTLILFIYLPASRLVAETENASWGSVKAEFSGAPAGKLVVTQSPVSSKAERNYSPDEHKPIPTVIRFLIENEDYSIFRATNPNDGLVIEWLDFVPSVSGRKGTASLRQGLHHDGWYEINDSFFKSTFPSLYYKVVLMRYNGRTGEEEVLGEWYGVPVNIGSTNMFLFEIGHGWKTVTKDTCCG